jgi:demethylmenaquinone methyltransferase / 2-methoxy-6-polyprenyl-1,4-benzoquinol methylase
VSAEVGQRFGGGAMFDAIAARYDFVNRVLSLGLDQGWRRRAVDAMRLGAGSVAIDLATGTGDLALMAKRRHPEAVVRGMDPSTKMLAIARDKARAIGAEVTFVEGDAQAIEAGDGEAAAVSIAFGIRNVPDRPRALREMARVTRAGGRVVVLELTEPTQRTLGRFARLYVHEVVPRVGGALSGADEYAYLQRSIAAFPPADHFAETMRDAGLEVLSIEPLTFGVVTLFVATPRKAAA